MKILRAIPRMDRMIWDLGFQMVYPLNAPPRWGTVARSAHSYSRGLSPAQYRGVALAGWLDKALFIASLFIVHCSLEVTKCSA